jgi:hypothetical protein
MTRTFLAAHGDSGDQPGSRDVFSRSKTGSNSIEDPSASDFRRVKRRSLPIPSVPEPASGKGGRHDPGDVSAAAPTLGSRLS